MQSNGPLKLGKLFLFEGGIRVPMIIKLPGTFEPNSVYDQPTSTLDLFPTICHAAGIKLPPEISLDGVDLTPFIKGTVSGSPHDTLFWSNGPNCAVRHRDWKLVKSYDSIWLFNLASDIGESKNLAKSEVESLATELLERVELLDKKDEYPARLSGGQQQRVAIARALAMKPRVMLFDEPTSSLDPELIGEVLGVMRSLAEDGTTMIVVTHEIGFAREVSDRVVLLHNGGIEEDGSPGEVIDNPQSARSKQFFSSILH